MKFEQKVSTGFKYVVDLITPVSVLGAEQMKKQLNYTKIEQSQLETEYSNIEKTMFLLKTDRTAFDELLNCFSQIRNISNYIDKIKSHALNDEEFFELKSFLMICQNIRQEFDILNRKIQLEGINFLDISDAVELLSIGQPCGGFFISSDYSSTLTEIRILKTEISKYLDLDNSGEQLSGHIQTYHELCAKEEAEEANVRRTVSKKLNRLAKKIKENIKSIAALDILIQKAELAIKYKAVRPKIGDKLRFVNMLNPMIKENVESKGRTFTPISLDAPNGVTIITGANMGGKTATIKTIAMNAFLALNGFFVFADEAEIPLYDFIDIVSDNLNSTDRGLSSFGGEVMRVNGLYERAKTDKCLILIDEFASGTNAGEGTKIFRAVVQAFNETKSTVIMTTHFEGVAVHSSGHYQVAGLKDAILDGSLKNLLSTKKGANGLWNYMNYELLPAGKDTEIPKDAINICRFLELNDEIMQKLEH